MKRRETGILGEKLAQNFLRKKGYHIIETNYRCPHGEIDIVAQKKDCLVFIEVRTKTSLEFGSPEESITAAKMGKLREVAAHFQQTHENLPASRRIDMMAIELDHRKRPTRIELIENAIGDG